MNGGVLEPAGPVASAELLILLNATGIMLVVVIPVIVLTFAFAWWYRAGNTRAAYEPDWEYSGHIELVVWSIPAMIVILVAGVGWIGSHQLDPGEKLVADRAPLRIEVVSMDWKWLFLYPDRHLASVNELTVPVGTPIELTLTSTTVMNAFFVPQLGSMIYTMPGMTSHLNLMAAKPGDYPGLSAHFSGDGFSDMRFVVHAVPEADYDGWAGRTGSGAAALDDAVLDDLGKAAPAAAVSYRDAAPDLFDRLVERSTAPAAKN